MSSTSSLSELEQKAKEDWAFFYAICERLTDDFKYTPPLIGQHQRPELAAFQLMHCIAEELAMRQARWQFFDAATTPYSNLELDVIQKLLSTYQELKEKFFPSEDAQHEDPDEA